VQVTVPGPNGVQLPGTGTIGGLTGTVTTTTTTTTTTQQGIAGAQYQYLSGLGAPQMAPAPRATSSAISQVRSLTGPGAAALGGGSAAQQGSYDTTPVFALDGTRLRDANASSPAPAQRHRPLSVPALLAVVVLLAAVVALVRIQQVRRSAGRGLGRRR
jgi:hypothetical protein